ncbi:NAD(P)/FAD-dependent oxidoreductase, partial [Pseudoxanthomonas sp. SGD-10]
MPEQKKIVIIGGGFAGINLAQNLRGDDAFQVTLVDKNNYNFFPPLIYQVATGFLENSNISYPFRKLFRGNTNIRYRLGCFVEINLEEKKVLLSTGELSYDYLVFATGTETNYFGLENVQKNAIPMKTLDDALLMRNRLLERLERAAITEDPLEKQRLLTIVIAGGGPTGVEISGILAELRNTVIKKEYPELRGAKSEIILVNGGSELLSPMSKKSQEYTYKSLEELGVRVILNTRVKDFKDSKVLLADGSIIEAETLLWASGVKALSFDGLPQEVYGQGNRLLVDEINQVKGLDGVYAIGDTCVSFSDSYFPLGHPQVAQVAMQQGVNLAENFKRQARGEALKPFTYKDK